MTTRLRPVGIPAGPGRFLFPDERNRPVPVWCHRPPHLPADAPVLFVMHGVKRDADLYRDNWMASAEKFGCLLLCPEFTKEDFPRKAYHLGNLVDDEGGFLPRSARTFGVIERLFDFAREATGNESERYHIYGHSAGGQFVHRMVMFAPESRFETAVAANSGWYTMPVFRRKFPYGLKGSGLSPERLREAFGRRLVVLLGTRDTDSKDPHLRRTSGARRQGKNRLERGLNFYVTARNEAAKSGAAFEWTLEPVIKASHFDPRMMPTALRAFFGNV
ncbi:MAG: alpha/beta hydrolase [Rubrobacteraceae bacterium]